MSRILRAMDQLPPGDVGQLAYPKGERSKPGKGAPTKAEREWLDFIVSHGCVCCRMMGLGVVPPEVHHILRGSYRMGHLHSLPLCASHHRLNDNPRMVSRHPWKAKFEDVYGTEQKLLADLRITFNNCKGST